MSGAIHDVVIVGGSFAGLTAALQLGRASRRSIVLDTGRPRNAASPAAHGVPGWDGTPPGDILDRFRQDLAAYPAVEMRPVAAVAATGTADAFEVRLADGEVLRGRRLLLAHGLQDRLPDIPGLAENWGRHVFHCPYCHGYEVRGRPMAVLAMHPMSAHQARLLRSDWGDDVTLITGGMAGFDADDLGAAAVSLDDRALAQVHPDGNGIRLVMGDGSTRSVGSLFVALNGSLAGSLAEQLGCLMDEGPAGDFVRAGQMKQTSVPGVFAAGDLAGPMPNVNLAIADGTLAGIGCHQSLVFPSLFEPVGQEAAA